jgi:hypothetical protein
MKIMNSGGHSHDGNRFAMPPAEDLLEDLFDAVNTNRLHTTTHLFQFGGQLF